jgi:DNA-binding LacI/PurR family transcriptional regulator
MAQSLRGTDTGLVGILWQISGPHNSIKELSAISSVVAEHKFTPLANSTISQWVQLKPSLQNYLSMQIKNIVVQVTAHLFDDQEFADIINSFKNVILITSQYIEAAAHHHQVIWERCDSVKELLGHFIGAGKDRICMLHTGLPNRLKTFKEFIQNEGIADKCTDVFCTRTEGTQADGLSFINGIQHIDDVKKYNAWFCSCDEGAAAVGQYLKDKGIRIPEDAALAGFNNSEFTNYFSPPLATVDRCEELMAEAVGEILSEQKRGETGSPLIKKVAMKFIPRESAG